MVLEGTHRLGRSRCPLCGHNAVSAYGEGGTMGDGMRFGSGYEEHECPAGHQWGITGWNGRLWVLRPTLIPKAGQRMNGGTNA